MKALRPFRWWATQLSWALRFVMRQFAEAVLTLHTHRYRRAIYALLLTNFVSIFLFLLRTIGADSVRYWFMLRNLVLAWVSPLIAWWIVRRVAKTKWRTWQNIGLSVIWLGFLPNSFYMVSDLIHVHQTGEVSIIFDAVLFTSFIFNGFIAGFMGVLFLHRELLRRMTMQRSFAVITGVFALCGYAIYLGRVLRWNTWDALLHPSGLLFDISDNILHPLQHMQSFVVTLSFTVLITSFYILVWEFMQTIRHNRG